MSGPANFLSRWSRLKRRANPAGDVVRVAPDADAGGVAREADAQVAPHQDGELAVGSADDLNLPSIDAITGDTDIRAFLRSQVPAALTRAALRKAWVSDPAIRDFIGIAENQWDFNDPAAMPGFGPLQAMDRIPTFFSQAVGAANPATLLEQPAPIEQTSAPSAERQLARSRPANEDEVPSADVASSEAPDDGGGDRRREQ
jgi:Protein of unknown function (DUF3306)